MAIFYFFLPLMAVFGGCDGTAAATAIFLKFMTREDFFLYSEIKTKPKNHGLRESVKNFPPPLV